MYIYTPLTWHIIKQISFFFFFFYKDIKTDKTKSLGFA